jgi:hypothetical protein
MAKGGIFVVGFQDHHGDGFHFLYVAEDVESLAKHASNYLIDAEEHDVVWVEVEFHPEAPSLGKRTCPPSRNGGHATASFGCSRDDLGRKKIPCRAEIASELRKLAEPE